MSLLVDMTNIHTTTAKQFTSNKKKTKVNPKQTHSWGFLN